MAIIVGVLLLVVAVGFVLSDRRQR